MEKLNVNFKIENIAKNYVAVRFPRASEKEKNKIINDWINKIEITRNIVADFRLRVADPRGLKILDAGSGNGGTCISFAEAGAEVFGIDVENDLIEIARLFAESYKVKAEFVLYDGETIPFSDNSFDAALSISVLEHVSDPINYLSEILRVLKPGGYLYLALPNRLWPRETHTLLWGITYLSYKAADMITRFFKRNPLPENNLHFYTYWDVMKMLKKAEDNDDKFKIVEEKGFSKSLLKKIIKNGLKMFGLSYKIFLPHIQVILKKQS